MGGAPEPDPIERGCGGHITRPVDVGPEFEGLDHAKTRPHGVPMSAVMKEGPRFGICTLKGNAARERMQQAGEREQEGGFARAIGSAQQQGAAGGDLQRQICGQHSIAAATGKALCLKIYPVLDLPLRHGPISYWTHGRTGKGLVD
ncbi:MAG: hypothetical protein Devi2KO_26460 [Devosia indica]